MRSSCTHAEALHWSGRIVLCASAASRNPRPGGSQCTSARVIHSTSIVRQNPVRIWRHRCPKIPRAHFRRHGHEQSPHESLRRGSSEPDRGQMPTIKKCCAGFAGEKESRGCDWKEDCVISENDMRLFEVHLEIPALVRGVELWFLPGWWQSTAAIWHCISHPTLTQTQSRAPSSSTTKLTNN